MQNVQTLEQVKEQTRRDRDLESDEALKMYEELGLFSHRSASLPKTWMLTHTIRDKKAEFKINGKFVIIDPFKKVIEFENETYPLDQKLVSLLKGEDISGFPTDTLKYYYDLMSNVGASKRSRRFRDLEQRLHSPHSVTSSSRREFDDETSIAPTKSDSDDAGTLTPDEERVSALLADYQKEQEELQRQLDYFKWSFDKNYIANKSIKDPHERYNSALQQTTGYLGYNLKIDDEQVKKIRSMFLIKHPFETYEPSKSVPTVYKGKGFKEIVFLSDNPYELFERLKIIIAANKEGHNNVFNEKHAILMRLLEKKFISREQYKLLARK